MTTTPAGASLSKCEQRLQPFAQELAAFPVVACASFFEGRWVDIVTEGDVAAAANPATAEQNKREIPEDAYLLSRSLAAAEKAAVARLAAAAKVAAGEKAEEADTVGNDQLGLEDD